MKYGSYIGHGYKYGLLSNVDELESNLRDSLYDMIKGKNDQILPRKNDIEVSERVYPEMVIPFESVDGLSIDDLRDYQGLLFENRYLVFIMYDSIELREKEKGCITRFTEPVERVMARYVYLIDTEKNRDCTIDEIIEDHLVRTVNGLNKQNRRRALGFLEQYICTSNSGVRNIIYDSTKQYVSSSRLRISNNGK